MTEIEAFAILSSIPNLGAVRIRSLLQYFGSALDAINASDATIGNLPGFSRLSTNWGQWKNNSSWQRNLDLARRYGAELIPFNSPLYPKSLLEIHDHPALLYIRGTLKPEDGRSIAVIGTRNATIYGLETAETISRTLAANGFTVISGLARGIDTAAHNGALQTQAGRTIAVIGSGLAKVYPAENQGLADAIAGRGALISEFPMETPPDRQNFPQRNRIVSGMSMGTLLIEAPIKSGAMITMDRAYQHKRKLFALPGRADNENFRGNHMLIKSGRATLVESAEDIILHFDGLFAPGPANPPSSTQPHLDKEESELLTSIPAAEFTIDELARSTSIPVQHVQRILMSLMLKKIIKEFPGKIYKKTSAGNTIKRHN